MQQQQQQQMKSNEPEHALGLPDVELIMGDDDVDLNGADAALLGDFPPVHAVDIGVPSIATTATRPGDPYHIYKKASRVMWTDADKKVLIKALDKHKNAWAKMVRDDTLHFSEGLSSSLPKVFANKLKAYARSPAFKTFVASTRRKSNSNSRRSRQARRTLMSTEHTHTH